MKLKKISTIAIIALVFALLLPPVIIPAFSGEQEINAYAETAESASALPVDDSRETRSASILPSGDFDAAGLIDILSESDAETEKLIDSTLSESDTKTEKLVDTTLSESDAETEKLIDSALSGDAEDTRQTEVLSVEDALKSKDTFESLAVTTYPWSKLPGTGDYIADKYFNVEKNAR